MHSGELWQEFDARGERVDGAGYDATLGNPEKGSYVGASAVWLYRRTDAGVEVLFQQRSLSVNNGGKWDVSAGGHINNGERTVNAAVRELHEEIGVNVLPEDLEFIFKLKTFFKVQMFTHYYLCDWTGREDEFAFDDGEVSAVKWIKLVDFDKFVDENAKDAIKNAFFTRELTKFWLNKKNGNFTK